MWRFVRNRALQLLITAFAISFITFMLLHLTQDPVLLMVPPDAGKEAIERTRHDLGFDRPLFFQYGMFLARVVRGDFGVSLFSRKPALDMVIERMPATLLLTISSLSLALLIAVPLGVKTAVRRHTWVDNLGTTVVLFGQAMPLFWFGIMMMLVFSMHLHWLPASGYGSWKHLILPMVSLGIWNGPITMRLVRSQMLDILSQDFVRSARARGLREGIVVWRHAFKNALIPVVTVVGTQFGQLLGGAIVCETVFSWPGVASLTIFAIKQSDFPVVQAGVITLALFIVVVNLVVDLALVAIDPRIRLE